MAQEVKGSIHDDATASKLGFRGGTVAGSIHMDQFVPGLLAIYGDGWFQRGSISLYFTQATVDAEKVRATVEPGPERARLTMHNEAGALICEGTATVGRDATSELARRFEAQTPAEPQDLRILKAMRIGDERHDLPVRIESEALTKALETLTEPLPAYRDDRVLPPSHLVRLAHITRPEVHERIRPDRRSACSGLWKWSSWRDRCRAGVDYLARTRVLKFSEGPKTENVWYEVIFTEANWAAPTSAGCSICSGF